MISKLWSMSLAILIAIGFASPVCCQVGAGYFESDPFAANAQPFSFHDSVELSNRIPVTLRGEWITDAGTSLSSYETAIKFPILKIFGTPPPIVRVGFDYTNLESGIAGDFPEDLFEYSVSVSRVKRWTDRWVFRSSIGVAYATDNKNRTGDAWQFRGSAFGIYQYNPWWQFSVGAIALGRRDLPIIPAVGAVWTPNAFTRVDLIPPIPTANFLISDNGSRQRWLYTGFGFSGNTWAYESPTLGDDVLTYRDLRLVAGWYSTPKPPPGIPYARGRKNRIELGYAFSRELEFEDDTSNIDLGDSFLLRLSSDY